MALLTRNAASKLVDPTALRDYLQSTGWEAHARIPELAVIWKKAVGSETRDLLQPISSDAPDYLERIYLALDELSSVESRPIQEILASIGSLSADLIQVQIRHEDVDRGTIPIRDGAELFASARDMMTAVVLSVYQKKKWFIGKPAEVVSRFLDSVHFGQTEKGSFVVNILAPLEVIPSELGYEEHLGRLVSDNAISAVRSLAEALQIFNEQSDFQVFERTIDKGVSANLCDSIIGMSGTDLSRDLTIRIKRSPVVKSENEPIDEVSFKSSQLPLLREVSEYLKGYFFVANYQVSGYVEKMQYEDGDETGKVHVRSVVFDSFKLVQIELPVELYWNAVIAHQNHHVVECIGTLVVTPKSAKLENFDESTFRLIRSRSIDE